MVFELLQKSLNLVLWMKYFQIDALMEKLMFEMSEVDRKKALQLSRQQRVNILRTNWWRFSKISESFMKHTYQYQIIFWKKNLKASWPFLQFYISANFIWT